MRVVTAPRVAFTAPWRDARLARPYDQDEGDIGPTHRRFVAELLRRCPPGGHLYLTIELVDAEELSPLASRAPGAGGADLVTPCQRPMPTRCAPLDPLPPGTLPLGVALSGGSFRATLAGLGMLRYLTDAGLRRARSISIATAPPAAQGESDNSLGSHIDQSDHVTRPGGTTL